MDSQGVSGSLVKQKLNISMSKKPIEPKSFIECGNSWQAIASGCATMESNGAWGLTNAMGSKESMDFVESMESVESMEPKEAIDSMN